jgi:hypothetical protein
LKNETIYLFVLIGMFFGWMAGRREAPWHAGRMVGIGGGLGLAAFYVYDKWGVAILIGGWLALALLFWGADWFSKWRRRRREPEDETTRLANISAWLTTPATKDDKTKK